MAHDWTSVSDILDDLSLVQGSGVPANIEQIIGAQDRPPSPDLSDSNSSVENPHELCTDFKYPAPDLDLIKEMLNLVRDKDVSLDEDTQYGLNISNTLDVNEKEKDISPRIVTKNEREPNKRNVALTSILQIKSESKPVKLLKPNDFVSKNIDETVEKVNGLLEAHSSKKHASNKKWPVVFDAGNMFKKKAVKIPKESDPLPQTNYVQQTCVNYKPSMYADKLYNEFKEKQRLKCMVQEDIWSRAERQMREIDEKRRLEAAKSSISDQQSISSQSN